MYLSRENLILKLRHYCAYQDRCHLEVEQKLKQLGADDEMAGEIVLHLLQEGFLNEERFARSYARGKFRMQQWGRVKIINGLKSKNVSEPLIKIALKEIDEENYYETLLKQLENSFQRHGDLHKSKSQLLAKGFEYELIQKAIDNLNK